MAALTPRSRVRILVLYCEEGEGHASAARALGQALEREPGVEVLVRDALAGGLGRLIPLISRDAYRLQVRCLRWTYGLEFALFARFPPGRWGARAGVWWLGRRPLRRLVQACAPDLVVSTHPVTTAVLGRMRRTGGLRVPLVATITDFGVHPLWAHAGADLHLVMHESAIPAVERIAGRGSARVAAPLVRREFLEPPPRAEARRALGLPQEGTVAVVTGGGWGVGDVVGVAERALAVPDLRLLVLAGRNELLRARLTRRFENERRVRVLGFTDRMGEVLAAADVLIDSSLGVTCLEALVVGCRIVACGVPPGHSRLNARSLAALGLARLAVRPSELPTVLEASLREDAPPSSPFLRAVPAAELVLACRARPERSRARLRPLVARAAVAVAALVLAGWTFASPTPYPLVARALDLRPLDHVATSAPAVGVIVTGDRATLVRVARTLSAEGIHASLAVDRLPGRPALVQLASLGDEAIPALNAAGPTQVLTRERELTRLAAALGWRGRYYYLAPRSGFTLAQYLAIRASGGIPVSGARTLGRPAAADASGFAPGRVVVLSVASPADAGRLSARLATILRADRLRGVTLEALLTSERRR